MSNQNNMFTPNLNTTVNPLTYLTDSYKVSHIKFEIDGVKEIYSNFTARFDKYMAEMVGKDWDKQYVVFGVQYATLTLQHLFKEGFFNKGKDVVMQEMKEMFTPYIGWDKYDHFEALHDLGYLPVKIKSLPEGTLTPIGCPFLTVVNTLPEFEWLPNYLESILSTLIWKPLTIATMSRFFRLKSNEFALATQGNLEGTEWQNHDFHVRGASGWESAAINGCAFLLSSCGTDNMPSIHYAEKYYGSTNKEGLLCGSVSAGEHSVTTLGILTLQRELNCSLVEAEIAYVEYVLSQMQTGIFSYVSDSFDYFAFLNQVLPAVKDEIMKRDGKFVVRGDSGNPVHIIAGYKIKDLSSIGAVDFNRQVTVAVNQGFEVVEDKGTYWKPIIKSGCVEGLVEIERTEAIGTIEYLSDLFGYTTNELGYKVLDSHIGMIYGDGITLERQHEILTRLKDKGFVSTSIVFGVGSYSLNLVGRDHLGMAIKATNAKTERNGINVDAPIYKDPKTDTSKKSAKGLLYVETQGNLVIHWEDQVSRDKEQQGALREVFVDGEVKNLETLFKIRERLWS